MNQERHVEAIRKGEIIVATMIAGRGTNIQTKEIEESGGLHIILTFLPNNQRVKDQAFGRTSRQGNFGTGQMILLSKINNDQDHQDIIKLHEIKKRQSCLTSF
jgi:preprotein translocase subunit SecA